MKTILTNILVSTNGEKKRGNFSNINPDINAQDAKKAMLALAELSDGQVQAIERTDKTTIFTAEV